MVTSRMDCNMIFFFAISPTPKLQLCFHELFYVIMASILFSTPTSPLCERADLMHVPVYGDLPCFLLWQDLQVRKDQFSGSVSKPWFKPSCRSKWVSKQSQYGQSEMDGGRRIMASAHIRGVTEYEYIVKIEQIMRPNRIQTQIWTILLGFFLFLFFYIF